MSETQELNPFDNRVIRASAGTGKTYQLSGHYLRLLDSDAVAEQILATTFTRKAAGEILDRVLLRLADAVLEQRPRRELADQLGDPTLDDQRCLAMLAELVSHLHRLRISTLDSFFAQVARAFSLELRLPPGWQVVEELDDARLRSEAIEAVLREDGTQATLQLVHLLTKGEASRGVSALLRDTVNQLYELFEETEHAAWQQLPRPKPLSPEEVQQTIEQLRGVPMEGSQQQKARDQDCQRADDGDWKTFIGKGIAKKRLEGKNAYQRKPIPDVAAALYDRLLDHTRAELVGLLALQTEGTWQLLEKFHTHYHWLKLQRRAFRFDDVTRGLSNAMRDEDATDGATGLGNVATLAFRLDSHIEHLLLDEFQDTSPDQWRVIRPFAQRIAGDARRSFFCVGDGKQAIYGWRGGAAEIFDCLPEELPNIHKGRLNESYRSAPPIMEAVNQVFANLERHPKLDRLESSVSKWVRDFPRHETAKKDLAGYACLETAPLAGKDPKQSDVTADYTAFRVSQLVEQFPGCSVGVLVRRNAVVGDLISRLRRLGIDASEEGGNPLTDSAAVEVILSALRLVDHPGDRVARFHVRNSALAEAVGLTDDSPGTSCRVARKLGRRLLDDGYGPLIGGWAHTLAAQCNQREANRLKQLVELAYGYQTRATMRADDFVEIVETRRVADPNAANVRVMTVHQSKGLEFDLVVLPDLDVNMIGQSDWMVVERQRAVDPVNAVCRYASREIQALLPSRFQQMFEDATDRTVTESLCVMYVALTRAAHALHMIIAPSPASQKSVPKTMAGLLRAALVDDQPIAADATVWCVGNRDWTPEATLAEATLAETAPPPRASQSIRLAAPKERPLRGLETVSPSSLEGEGRVKLADVFDRKRSWALQRGTLIHAWFEQIEWLDDGRPDPEALLQVARRELGPAGVRNRPVDTWRDEFLAMLDRPSVDSALRRANYPPDDPNALAQGVVDRLIKAAQRSAGLRLEVQNERPFAYRLDNQLMSGTIDRVVWIYDDLELTAAEVVDFKTDRLETSGDRRLSARIDYYRPQMEAYRMAVAHLAELPLENVAVRLVFTQADAAPYLPCPQQS